MTAGSGGATGCSATLVNGYLLPQQCERKTDQREPDSMIPAIDENQCRAPSLEEVVGGERCGHPADTCRGAGRNRECAAGAGTKEQAEDVGRDQAQDEGGAVGLRGV